MTETNASQQSQQNEAQSSNDDQKSQINDRLQHIVNYMASTLVAQSQRQTTGKVLFEVTFSGGTVPTGGCKRIMDEQV